MIEVDFADSYPAGLSATITVSATLAGNVVGLGRQMATLDSSCQSITVSIAALSGDLGVGDSAGDGPMAECAMDSQCTSGHCADGVCYDTACQGQCEACDVAGSIGICQAVSGKPHGVRTGCVGSTAACNGTYDGTNRTGCAFPSSSTICQMQACTAGMKLLTTTCDGAGSCPVPDPLACTPLACNTAGTDCASLHGRLGCTAVAGKPFCDHGVCTVNKPNGRTCAATTECTSGNCIDGVCCNQPIPVNARPATSPRW